MSEIIIFPEYEKIKTEIDKLRTELSMLFLEQDELRLVICKNIEMVYLLELGSLEYKAFEAQCAFLRLKRKMEIMQAKINRQERVDICAIEAMLDDEFAQFRRELDEQIRKMNAAIDRNNESVLSTDESNELKKLYRRIVKELHPDIDPNPTQERCALFVRAIEAYERADLETLRIIDEMLSGTSCAEMHEDTMGEMLKERDRLKAMLERVKESINKIKSEYPYTVKEIVEDENRISERRTELERIIEQYELAISDYKKRINEAMR